MEEVGTGAGEGFNINIPFPPGTGNGAYKACFDRVIHPALSAYHPELILVSAGFDASYMDPLAHMLVSSDGFRYMASVINSLAEQLCGGKVVYFHEGGYSELYVPFCGLAVVEEITGIKTEANDPFLNEAHLFAGQMLQPWQEAVIIEAEKHVRSLMDAMQIV